MLKPQAALNKDRTNAKGTLEHRHFAVIAGILYDMDADRATVGAWADALRSTNPRFDRERFIRAAGGL